MKQIFVCCLALMCSMQIGARAEASPSPVPTENQAEKATESTRVVTGTVIDATDNEPLIGATVRLKSDPKVATACDIDGNFTIKVTGKNPIIIVTMIGYKEKEVALRGLSEIEIPMDPSENSLDEVVVVGGGSQKRVAVTGAVTTVTGAQLKMPTARVSNALAGKLAGLITRQSSGEPGSGSSFYIRGISTFGGGNTPLILLDDVEISSGDLDLVPAENIESFTILKDASATAIYGARGANGVMIVTTKGGAYNTPTKLNVSIENSINTLSRIPEWADGATYMRTYNAAELARTPGVTPKYSDLTIERTASHENPYLYPDVDWYDELFKNTSMRQRVNVNVSGGADRVKYYMALDVQHEDGNFKTEKLHSWNNNINIITYSFQNNLSYKLTPSTTISMNMNTYINQRKDPNKSAADFWGYVHWTNPVEFPVYYPDQGYGHRMYGSAILTDDRLLQNPRAVLNSAYGQSNNNKINTVIKIDQDLSMITKGLKFNAWVNWNNYSSQSFSRSIDPHFYTVDNPDSYDMATTPDQFTYRRLNPTGGTDYISESGISKYTDNIFELQANLNWTRNFSGHEVSAMGIYRMREYRNAVLPNRNQGFSGRITYDYNHKYLAEFNFGYNGTERLAKADRFGFFPAGSLGWVISNEEWFKPLSSVITHLKLRTSYGITGSDDLVQPSGSYFLYIDKIHNNNLSYLWWGSGVSSQSGFTGNGGTGGGPMLTFQALRGIGWEKSKKFDIGAEIHLWGDLKIEADYYYEKRYDILMQRASWPWSLGSGFAIPYSACGKIDSSGLEGSVQYNKRINDDLNLSFQGTITYTTSKYVDVDEPNYPYPWTKQTGRQHNNYTQIGLIAEGLFKSQEEIDNSPQQQFGSNVKVGDIKYRDLNGDGVINDDDKTMISKTGVTPRLMYGFGGTVQYKKWDFGVFFTGSGMRTIMIGTSIHPFQSGMSNGSYGLWQYIADNYFDEAKGNFDAKYPRLALTSADLSNNNQASTYWMRNGSFLRLRNVEVGYTFKYGRVYLSGANLLTFSPFKEWDPELSSWNSYPMSRTVNMGVQFNL